MSLKNIARIVCLCLLAASMAGCIGMRRRPVVIVHQPATVDPVTPVVDCPTEAPPPPQVEVRTIAPSHVHVWVPGHWQWKHRRYVWVGGHWAKPTRSGAMWVSGHWEKSRGNYLWIEGHWR